MSLEKFREYSPQIHPSSYIAKQATIIGRVTVGEHSSVWPACVIRGDVEHINIGDKTNIQDGSILHVTHDGDYTAGGFPLNIGSGVTVGHGAILHACTIGDFCLIGMGSIILDGAIIEDYAMIGAGAVVPPGKRVKSGTLWLGNPAREIRNLSKEEMQRIEYSADHYVTLMQEYLNA